MLGGTLVTKQTGPGGKPVNTLLVAKKMKLGAEKYFALLLDRKSAGPVAIACSQGGTSIEELAEAYPDRIVRVPIDPLVGMTDSQAKTIVDALQTSADKADAAALIKSLYKLFSTRDVTLLEVNPLAECEGMLMCADTKLNFDDNAAFRQKDVFAQRDSSQEDPREVAAAKYDLNFIALDGNIGCMVNGAGLAMATMARRRPTAWRHPCWQQLLRAARTPAALATPHARARRPPGGRTSSSCTAVRPPTSWTWAAPRARSRWWRRSGC